MMHRTDTVAMVAPRADVEATVYYAKCKKCGKIIADDTSPLEVSGLKPEGVKAMRIMCPHRIGKRPCKQLNFVSHV